ncbi:hypothetical protein A3D88_00870 [Candidatus Peribacteria bacterium RIFCSPHIGHO2_02_FULL_52_16]|nr:MAG: hypothetical protein A2706_05515 [Candidatus Peribacteria bacterium RIFCSPHIGHO2_01_FULL_51_35]OGJ61219.1 MAG: hypothetical protein A3D88_00870 [Candidatus Peribacteria bacterium RIFCSPHIGHO2_02_FULL_52_16]
MNDDIHPYWHSTGEEPTPIKFESNRGTVRIPVGSRSISRRPAAVTGILLVLVLGFAFFDGLSQFRGTQAQTPSKNVASETVEVRITKDGAIPQSVNTLPGQEIVWTNEDDIPHILESETLVGNKGSTLYTPAIFPQATYSFIVAPNHEPGRHTYLSTTSLTVFGDVNVLSPEESQAAAPATPDEDAFPGLFDDSLPNGESESDEGSFDPSFTQATAEEPAAPAAPKQVVADDREDTIDSSDPLAPMQFVASTEETATPAASLVPVNPYTVGSAAEHPFADQNLHGGAPQEGYKSIPGYKPFKHTDTGPALWIVSGVSLAAFLFATRRFWKKFS